MADPNTIDDGSDSDNQMPSALIAQAFKAAHPSAQPADIIKIYNASVKIVPGLPRMTPEEQAQVMNGVGQMVAQKENASTANTTVPQPPELNTTLKSPYAGTKMAARNPQNPQAELMNAYDPEALKNAYAEYAQRYNATLPQRNLSQGLAATGGPDVLKSSQTSWELEDKRNALQTLDRQKALQEQAKAGIADATNIQNQFKTAGEYTGTQAAKQQELNKSYLANVLGSFDVQSRQRMNQPTSTETMLAKQLLTAQLNSLPETDKGRSALTQILSQPNITAEQLLPAMAQWAPEAMKAFVARMGAQKTAAEIGSMQQSQDVVKQERNVPAPSPAQVVNSVSGNITTPVTGTTPPAAAPTQQRTSTPNPNVIPADIQLERDREALKMKQAELAKETNPELIASLKREIFRDAQSINAREQALRSATQTSSTGYTEQDLKDFGPQKSPQQRYPTQVTTSPTGASTSPAPYAQQSQSEAKAKIDAASQYLDSYNQAASANAQDVLVNSKLAGRKLLNLANITNSGDVDRMKKKIDLLNQQLVRAGLLAQKQDSSGAAAVAGAAGSGMGAAGQKIGGVPGAAITGAGMLLSGASGLASSTQPLTIDSPQESVREASINLQILSERQKLLLPKLRKFAEANNYNIDGWTETPVYQQVMSMIPVVAPNGTVKLLDANAQMPRGYKTVPNAINTGL